MCINIVAKGLRRFQPQAQNFGAKPINQPLRWLHISTFLYLLGSSSPLQASFGMPTTSLVRRLTPLTPKVLSAGRAQWISRFTFWCPHYMSAQASVCPPVLIGSPPSQLPPLTPALSSLPARPSLLLALCSLPACSPCPSLLPAFSQLSPASQLAPACSQISPASQLTPSAGRAKWILRFTFWCPHYMSAQASVHPPRSDRLPPSQLTPLTPAHSQLTPAS